MNIPFDAFTSPEDPGRVGEAWKAHLAPVFDISFGRHTDLSTVPRILTCEFGPLLLGPVSAPAQQLVRAPKVIASQGVDHVLLQLYLSGSSRVEAGRRQSETHVGQILVADLAQPVLAQASAVSAINVVVPRSLLADRAGAVERLHGTALSTAGDPARRLLFTYLSDLVAHLQDVDAHQVGPLSTAAVELVRACFEPDASPAIARHRLAKIAVKRFIERNLGSSGLDVEGVAAHFSISRATLHRLFREEGGVGAYIRECRLQKARRRLAGRDGARASISQVAFATGFDSLSTFSRAFQRRFGLSPTDAAGPRDASDREHATADLIASWMCGFTA